MNISIRPYSPADREAVRLICADTADRGKPIEGIFADREVAADLLTGYYMSNEPQSCFVACDGDKVVGYVLACFDNRRYGLVMFFIVIPAAMIKAFKKGILFERWFWASFKAMAANWPRLFAWRKMSFHSHQGHLHIGVDGNYQRQGIGRRLVGRLLVYAQEKHIHDLTASVHDANKRACSFFERLGFKQQESYPMVMARGTTIEQYESILYVKEIS